MAKLYRNLYTHYLEPYLPAWQPMKEKFSPFNPNPASPLLQLLLITDIGFILLHLLLSYTNTFNNELFSLRRDKGYPEFFQYIKEAWISLLFVRQALYTDEPAYLVWSALFAYMLADDYLMLHENIGTAAAISLDIPDQWGFRSQDFGELGFYLLVGGTFFVLVVIAYRYGSATFQRNSIALVALLILFALFTVAADLLHVLLPFPSLDPLFDILEDGSEMLVMSLILWFVYRELSATDDFSTTMRGRIK